MKARGTLALVVILGLGALVVGPLGWLWDPDGDEPPGGYDALELDGESEDGEHTGPQLSADGQRTPARTKAPRSDNRLDGMAPGDADREAAKARFETVPTPTKAPNRIGGVVTDAEGNPIVGATVTLVPPGTALLADGTREKSFSVLTDDQGQFVHDDAQGGLWQVGVTAPGLFRVGVRATRGGDPLRVQMSVPVTLEGVLREKGTGSPIPKFSIWAIPSSAGPAGTRHMAQTDDEGRFRFMLPKGERFFVQYPYSSYGVAGTGGDWIHTRWGPFETERDDLVLELPRGLAIAGTVVDGAGLELTQQFRIEVLGRTPAGDPDYSRRRFTNTDAQGAFRVEGLPEGLYLVTVQPRAAAEGVAPSELTKREVEGIAGGTEDLVIELSRGEVMVGEIVDDEGNFVTVRGYVHVYPQGSSAGSPDSVHGKLDGKGGFATAPLDPGTAYDLLVAGFEGFSQARVEGARPGEALVRVTLERAGIIRGKVVREDGLPVPAAGLAVMAMALDAEPRAKGGYGYTYAKADGSFTMNGLGEYTFRLTAGGASGGMVSAAATEGLRPGSTDVVVKVKPGVSLSGTLLDANGDPAKTHMLTAAPMAGNSPSAWTSIPGDDGRFHFAGVPAGKVRILARIGGKSVQVGEVTAPAKDVVLRVPGE